MGNSQCCNFINIPGVTKLVQLAPSPCVQVFLIDLVQANSSLDISCLSAAEMERAARFDCTHNRTKYLTRHFALRHLLAQFTGITPQGLVFAEGKFGKPSLAHAPTCFFNLSHSERWALVGIAQGPGAAEMGVDIESLRPLDDLQDLADQLLNPQELEKFKALPIEHQNHAFLGFWTHKESTQKAWGYGIYFEPKHAGIDMNSQGPRVALKTFTQQTQFVASVALETG